MLKNTVVPFAVGAIVGVLVHIWWVGRALQPIVAAPAPISQESIAILAPRGVVEAPPTKLVARATGVLARHELRLTGTVEREVSRNQEPSEPDPQHLVTLSLDEALVGELEQNRERLHETAYSETTGDGWRIHILREDNLFARTGLRDGDLVTYDGLNEQLQKAGRLELATRVSALLNDLRR